jgi:hypothetical protein
MKFRQDQPDITESDERELVEAVRALERGLEETPPPAISGAYWQNLIIRTNRRVDEATSGKAISISWAARVAIPGIVAIVSFLIALQYYVPVQTHRDRGVEAFVLALPARAVDSLMTDPSLSDETLVAIAANENLFDVPSEQIGEYFIDNGNAAQFVDLLPTEQADHMLNLLAK